MFLNKNIFAKVQSLLVRLCEHELRVTEIKNAVDSALRGGENLRAQMRGKNRDCAFFCVAAKNALSAIRRRYMDSRQYGANAEK